MKEVRSELSPGHIVALVENIEGSISFYEAIGLPAFMHLEHLALIELRGGAHLMLMKKGSEESKGLTPSHYGGQDKEKNGTFDFMIKGNTKEELELFRTKILSNGVEVSEVNEVDFGHYLFSVTDPDGHNIYIYTSHEIKYML